MSNITRRTFLKGSAAAVAALAVSPEIVSCSGNSGKTREAGKYDVVVCGGGPAGFIAAVAAARQGAKTALIEQYGFLGGMATAGYVAPISEFAFNGNLVIGGIPWEFVERLLGISGARKEWPKGNVDFDPELYKLAAQRMVLEAGVDLFMHSSLIGCEAAGKKITKIIIANKNGLEAISGKVFIDCTGDADLSHLMQMPMQPNPDAEVQPSSFCFILSGVDTSTEMMQKHMHHNGLNGRSQCNTVRDRLLELKAAGADIPDFGGPWFNEVMHEGSVAVNITRHAADSTDNRNFTEAECQLREDIFTFTRLLKENFPEFRNCYVSSTAPQAGVRESRRILGLHTVTGEDYLGGLEYEDTISRGAHPIDIHAIKGSSQVCRDLQQAAFIPYRALVAKGFPNIIVAGRCISCDRIALASLRVQASCMGMGQAAGAAAAQSIRKGCAIQDIDTEELRTVLKNWGAVI